MAKSHCHFGRFFQQKILSDLPNIRVTQYQWGGGAAGNGGANTITSLETAIPFVASVTNLRPAVGGADEETVAQAEDRAPQAIRTQSRAVIADDYKNWPRRCPAGRLLQPAALPPYNPSLDISAGVPGMPPLPKRSCPEWCTVIVVPQRTARPRLRDDHRPPLCNWWQLTGSTSTASSPPNSTGVIGPTYRQVQIIGNVIAQPMASEGQVALQLQQILLAYFNPLTGGNLGQGWTFGGTIYFSEVYRQILVAPGVLRIAANAIAIVVDGKPQPAGQDILLKPNELVYSTSHAITVTYK